MQRQQGPASAPAADDQFAIRLVRVKEKQSLTFRFLSPRYTGVLTHFYRDLTRWCPGKADCNPQAHRLPVQWRGYCAAELWHDDTGLWYPCALEISEHAELDVRGRYQRGQIWNFSRGPDVDKKRAPITARFVGNADSSELMDPFEYQDVVRNVYHSSGMVFDKANPLPPKILAVPSRGTPPPGAHQVAGDQGAASAEEVHNILEAWRKKHRQGGGA